MVTIIFKDTQPIPQPLEGVLAKVFKDNQLIVAGTSNEEGIIIFDIPDDTYELIVSYPGHYGYMVKNPYKLVVDGDVKYEIRITMPADEAPENPYICRCSGVITNSALETVSSGELEFTLLDDVVRVDNIGLSRKNIVCKIVDGRAEVNLIRGCTYHVRIPWRAFSRVIEVPDIPVADLNHVLFPSVARVEFEPSTLTLAVGEEKEVYPRVYLTSGVVKEGALALVWVNFEIENTSVALITSFRRLIIKGISPGKAKLLARQKNQGYVTIPESLSSFFLPITITT